MYEELGFGNPSKTLPDFQSIIINVMSQVFQLVRNSKLYHFYVYELVLYSVPYLPISAFRSLLLEALLWIASLQKTLPNLLVPENNFNSQR